MVNARTAEVPIAPEFLAQIDESQIEIARLACAGLYASAIQNSLAATNPRPPSKKSVQAQVSGLCKQFEVADQTQLAAVLTPDDSIVDRLEISHLDPSLKNAFEFMAYGKTRAEHAARDGLATSTVGNYRNEVRKQLGLDNQIELTRAAFAYKKRTTEAAHAVKDETVSALQRIEKLQDPTKLRLDVKAAYKLTSQDTIRKLLGLELITDKMAKSGVVGLAGLVAAMLLRNEATNKYFSDPLTLDYTRVVIQQEVGVFLADKSSAAV